MQRLDPHRLLLERTGAMRQPALIYAGEQTLVENEAVRQLQNTACLDPDAIVFATPDIHTGFGVPIGCVFATPNLISPCAVGYDINCGMRLMTSPLTRAAFDAPTVARAIARRIPLGEGKHNIRIAAAQLDAVLEQGLAAVPDVAATHAALAAAFSDEEYAHDRVHVEDGGALPGDADAVSARAKERGSDQLATLGGGNHFIELQYVDTVYDAAIAAAFGLAEQQITIMIHSGSRGLGYQVADEQMHAARVWDEHQGRPLPDRELAYFAVRSREGQRYRAAMNAAANYAFVNRYLMALLARAAVRDLYGADTPLPTLYDVPHNIAKFETHRDREYCVHRKGATRAFAAAQMDATPFAQTGQPVLIPGSMGTASYVLAGVPTGAESLFSVNHGAGRTMSRSAARGNIGRGRPAAISDSEFRHSMEGITLICEDRGAIKEEAPAAYKDIDDIIRVVAGAGLAAIVARLRPLAVLKG
jgi:tRNA-splicing ligase RtcB